jgi:putative phosphoribosyl transferase
MADRNSRPGPLDHAYDPPEVEVSIAPLGLPGTLVRPAAGQGIVLFAHGSGSSRLSPRNQLVARILRSAGLATLLFDLLSQEEEQIDMRTRHLRFDIKLLAERVLEAASWLETNAHTQGLKVGLFGSSTGGAAALEAAARNPERIQAVVSRGGRPDLAGPSLLKVKCATLLIVGERDETVLGLNRQALERLNCTKELVTIPGASHLFEEPGALEKVAVCAADWFKSHLV